MAFAEAPFILTPLPASKLVTKAVYLVFELFSLEWARNFPARFANPFVLLHGVATLRDSENAWDILHREASKRTAAAGTATGDPRGLARNLGG